MSDKIHAIFGYYFPGSFYSKQQQFPKAIREKRAHNNNICFFSEKFTKTFIQQRIPIVRLYKYSILT